jgi:prephenate dehydratase
MDMTATATWRVVGVRGATTVEHDTLEAVLDATQDLLERLRALNDIDPDDIASIVFSTTRDLTSTFPARAARRLGWVQVPMLCTHEVDAPSSVPRCVRVLIHWNTTRTTREVRHAYLRDSRLLRPDWAWPPLSGPAGAVLAPEDPVKEAAFASGPPEAPSGPPAPLPQALALASLAPITFQGEHGAYSQAAAVGLLAAAGLDAAPADATRPSASFASTLADLLEGRAASALLPVENSTTGSIQEVWDLLVHAPVSVLAEVILPVRHALLAPAGASLQTVRAVASHPQALSQCARWIAAHGWAAEPASDTAGAARAVAERGDPQRAAIASALAAEIHGLQVLAADVQDIAENYTRFLLLSRKDALDAPPARVDLPEGAAPPARKTSIVFATRHAPGTLYGCLAEFAVRDISLTRIESRPDRMTPWNYIFFVDIAGDAADPRIADALAALSRHAAFSRVLGAYPTLHLRKS